MGGRNLIIIGVALALGLIAVVLANSYFSGVEKREEARAEEMAMSRIVVATQPLEFGTPLNTNNLRMQTWPAASVPAGAFRTIQDAIGGGNVALRAITPGEPVLLSKISDRAILSANLPPGMRAISIPVSAVSSVSGFVRPNDTVDVMLTRQIPGDGATGTDQMVDVILEKVRVLAIDQVADENATQPGVGKTAVVEVDLLDAQKLVLAQKLGQLSLALRNVENTDPAALTTVTARDLGGSGQYIAARNTGGGSTPNPGMFSVPNFVFPQEPRRPARSEPREAAPAPASAEPRSYGPTMTVVRGTEQTEESVGRLGR